MKIKNKNIKMILATTSLVGLLPMDASALCVKNGIKDDIQVYWAPGGYVGGAQKITDYLEANVKAKIIDRGIEIAGLALASAALFMAAPLTGGVSIVPATILAAGTFAVTAIDGKFIKTQKDELASITAPTAPGEMANLVIGGINSVQTSASRSKLDINWNKTVKVGKQECTSLDEIKHDSKSWDNLTDAQLLKKKMFVFATSKNQNDGHYFVLVSDVFSPNETITINGPVARKPREDLDKIKFDALELALYGSDALKDSDNSTLSGPSFFGAHFKSAGLDERKALNIKKGILDVLPVLEEKAFELPDKQIAMLTKNMSDIQKQMEESKASGKQVDLTKTKKDLQGKLQELKVAAAQLLLTRDALTAPIKMRDMFIAQLDAIKPYMETDKYKEKIDTLRQALMEKVPATKASELTARKDKLLADFDALQKNYEAEIAKLDTAQNIPVTKN